MTRYPVYIISKGRWKQRQTARCLEDIGVDYRIVIEPQEYDQYAAGIAKSRILVLPFSNLGQGSIPARNWVWEHAIESGASRHWIMDDNIPRFYRLNSNKRVMVRSDAIFRAMEDFVDRYENVPIAGPNYQSFIPHFKRWPPYRLNTRIYSCILLSNDIPFRWRGRYNEDTDLSIRILKAGYCSVLFLAFLQAKTATMTMKGGNTDELYQGDGRLEMAKSLLRQHPDVTTIKRKWGRWQHEVDYRPFKNNKLIKKSGTIKKGVDNYGMVLKPRSAKHLRQGK